MKLQKSIVLANALSFALFFSACSSMNQTENETEPAKPVAKTEPTPERTSEVNSQAPTDLRKKILVLRFINRSLYGGDELSKGTAWSVAEEIGKLPQYTVITQDDLQESEVFLSSYGEYNWKKIFESARVHGISGVVGGTIEDVVIEQRGDDVGLLRTQTHTVNASVKFQLHDVLSEKPVVSRLTSAEITDETTRLLGGRTPDSYDASRAQGAVNKALEVPLSLMGSYAKRIAWVGRIVKVDLHRFYVNAGESSGLSKGQLLKVFGEGQPVVDYDTGANLGVAPGRFKGTLKIVDFFGPDGAVAVLHSGAGFREKDRVEIYYP